MISLRTQQLKPSPTLALAAKARELKSQGHDVISLSVGEPDWDTLESAKQAGITAIQNGDTKYAPANGTPLLRQAIAEQTNSDLGTDYRPEQVTVSVGGKFIIFSALQSLIDPGDEVIIPSPYWVSYPPMVELAQGRPVIVDCGKSSQFKVTAEQLEKAITAKSKMLILNSPSNPTGYIYSKAELNALAEVLRRHPRVVVLSDDIYNRLVFNDEGLAPHILHDNKDLKDRVLVINGASKTYSMTGWRVGWALGPQAVIQAMNNYQSQSVSCAAPFSQAAAVAAIKTAGKEFLLSLERLKSRRDFVYQQMKKLKDVDVEVPQGAFYIWPDLTKYLGRSWRGRVLKGSKELAEALLESKMVATVPGVEFGCEGYLRISFVLEENRMKEAIQRLGEFLDELE